MSNTVESKKQRNVKKVLCAMIAPTPASPITVATNHEASFRYRRFRYTSFLSRAVFFATLISAHLASSFAPNCLLSSSSRFARSTAQLPSPSISPSRASQRFPTASYASAALLDVPSPSRVSDFTRRMRELTLRERTATRQKKTAQTRPGAPNVRVVSTLEEYKEVMGESKNKLVVVRFYATWCKACKAVAPLFYRLANTYEDVVFVEVPVTDQNANLHQGLGVPSLPFGHIYDPEVGLVEEMRISRKFFSNFARAVQAHVEGFCLLGEDGSTSNPYFVAEELKETAL